MQQSNEVIYSYNKDEFDLEKIFNSLVARKFIIFSITAFVTLLSIIYALYITPTYKVVSSFTLPSDISTISIDRIEITKSEFRADQAFSNFLTILSSKEFQKKVFIDGGYLTAFNQKNKPIEDVDMFVLRSIESVVISPPEVKSREYEIDLGYHTESPYSVSMEGANPIGISNYLNELVAAANANTINELIELIKKKIKIRLEVISKGRQLLIVKEKQKRLNEIEMLTDAALIAKSLGIIDNNLNQIVGDKYRSDLTIKDNVETPAPPDWYLYGEKALLERVNVLKNRKSDEPFIPELVNLDNEKLRLELHTIDAIDLNAMQLRQFAIAPTIPIKPNKKLIVLIAFFGSLMFSIFLALAMNALKPPEKTLPK